MIEHERNMRLGRPGSLSLLCWRGCPVVIGHMSPFDVHLATLPVSFQSSSFITGSLPANASLHEPSNRHHLLLFAPLQPIQVHYTHGPYI